MKVCAVLVLATILSATALQAQGQAPYLFRMTFRGTAYETNANNQVVGVPITEKDILLGAAQAGGSSDISSLALVYHIMGDVQHGDTIEVWDVNTRQMLTTLFGLYFGDDSLGTYTPLFRTALTNSVQTAVRREDYIYMFDNTTYTYQNPGGHSMGACFTAKRFMGDSNGNAHTTIDGEMQWVVNPLNGAGTKLIKGNFTTTRPF